jgi:putative heme-binding domain-containing protein
MLRLPLTFFALALSSFSHTPLFAEEPAAPRTDQEILSKIKAPEGYDVTLFAAPPNIGYPTSVSASIDGVLFVAIDENGSIDQKPNRGRVVRCIDRDGDGKADQFTTFAEMDSPRGVIWDGSSGKGPGTLYVMHPPELTAYHDDNGDGVSDRKDTILSGLGFGLNFRGADHTTNDCRLAIDGFIYIAVGDYGFTKAVAKDGTALSMRGGGIVRVRPDGTGFEIVSHGQRNIYDVAISPTRDLFTRDNTNDGGGWDVRLSHVPAGAHMGYPTLFKTFPEEILEPMSVLGGGSPTGALWIDEPGLQNGLYTVEWGRNAIMYHPLQPHGATFRAEQQEWMKITRPVDMDVDATGRIYIASWDGATFTYNGPNAGYVVRLVKRDAPRLEVPDLTVKRILDSQELAAEEVLKSVASPSASLRLAAQREILRRVEANPGDLQGVRAGACLDLVEEAVKQGNLPVAYAGKWIFILGGRGRVEGYSIPLQSWKSASAEARLLEVRAHGDPALDLGSNKTLLAALTDEDARIRASGVTALKRRRATTAASAILPLVADSDPVVAHLAVRALTELGAVEVCLSALDSADEKVKAGALRALYFMYDPAAVDGLISRLEVASPELRRGALTALCRLANRDAPFADPKEWWGTRPDTSGPVYKPTRWAESEKIEAALKRALDSAGEEESRWLVQTMYRTKVNFPGLIELMLTKSGSDTAAKLTAIDGLFGNENALPKEAAQMLQSVATNEAESPEIRARALRQLQKGSSSGSVFPFAIAAFAPLAGHDLPHPTLTAAFEEFTRDAKHTRWIDSHARAAAGDDAAQRALAQTVLVNLATSALVKGRDKEKAGNAVAKSWEKPETAASLLDVIARAGAKAYADEVRAKLNDPNNAVAESALFAVQKLGLRADAMQAQHIGAMKYDDVFAAVASGGDAGKGNDVYLRAGCLACHTTAADEPPKGPVLSAAAKIYDRAALTESILKPNAKLAQGFESAWFKTKKGEQVEGFVTREGGDSLDVRNVVGQVVTLEKGDIAERGKHELSMMPEGLMNAFTPAELASLLAYLESLKGS